jgi:hypothetical protein
MRIGKTIIIPALLALGAAASILAGSAAAAAAHSPDAHAHSVATSSIHYHT